MLLFTNERYLKLNAGFALKVSELESVKVMRGGEIKKCLSLAHATFGLERLESLQANEAPQKLNLPRRGVAKTCTAARLKNC